MTAAYPINPMYLLGKTITFTEVFPLRGDEVGPPDICIYDATVAAVQVPSPFSNLPWALLLQLPQFFEPEPHYTSLDTLYFQWPSATISWNAIP